MLKTRTRKIWRDIQARKVRTALVCSSIFVGVLGVVTLLSLGDIVVSQLEATMHQDELSMIYAYTAVGLREVDNAAAMQALNALPGIEVARGMAIYPLYWRLPDAERMTEGRIFAYFDPFGEILLESPRLHMGRYPIAGQRELMVERRLLEKHGLKIGDSLVVRALGSARDGGEIQEEPWTIVGTVFNPYQYPVVAGGPTVIAGETMIFAAYEDAKYLGGFAGFNLMLARYGTFEEAQQHSKDFEAALVTQTSYIPVFTILDNPAKNSFIEAARRFGNVVSLLAMVALLVAGFLVFNVINAIVIEQRRQIGLMKALGATAGDNFSMYSGLAFAYGLIGMIPGVLLGVPFGFYAARGLAPTFNIFIDEFRYSPSAIVAGVLLGLLVPVLGAVLPVSLGIRVKIIEAMTDLGIETKYGGGPLERLVGLLPLPHTLRQSLSNVLLKKGRLALTVITLALAIGAFMGVYAMIVSLDNVVDNIFGTFGNQIGFSPSTAQEFEPLRQLVLSSVDGLKEIEPWTSLAIEIPGYKPQQLGNAPPVIVAFGFSTYSDQVIRFNLRSGAAWEGDPERQGVVVAARIADALGVDVGDTLPIRAGGRVQEFEIIGVSTYPFDTVWFDWRALALFGGLTNHAGEPWPNSFAVIMEQDNPTADDVQAKIDEINEVLLANGITANYTNWVQGAEDVSELVTTAAVFMNIAAFLIALVGAIGLLTTLSMSVFERQKEIGVMRSIGASSATIGLQFLTEGLLVGLVAWIIGIPLSYWLNDALIATFHFEDALGVTYPQATLLIGLAGMLVIATVASLWPAIAATRKTVSEVLRYQ